MKVTNFELSEKLWKVGFRTNYNYGYVVTPLGVCMSPSPKKDDIKSLPAYDLETILEALPKSILSSQVGKEDSYYDDFPLTIDFSFKDGRASIAYMVYPEDGETVFEIDQQDNESLADLSARLLILLHERNIINFNN